MQWSEFFSCPIFPWRAESSAESLESCIIHVSAVAADANPEVAGSNPAVEHIFCKIFRCSLAHSYFIKAKKNRFFSSTKTRFLWWTGFFAKSCSICDVTSTNCFLLNIFQTHVEFHSFWGRRRKKVKGW